MSLEETVRENLDIVLKELEIIDRAYKKLTGGDNYSREIDRFRRLTSETIEGKLALKKIIPVIEEMGRFATGVLLDGNDGGDKKFEKEGGGEPTAQLITDLRHDLGYSFSRLKNAGRVLSKAASERGRPEKRGERTR